MRRIMLSSAIAAGVLVVGAFLIPQGEIVTLHTTDDEGYTHSTDLWIVEIDGRDYLRAGDPNAGWVKRIRARPEVELSRSHSETGPMEPFRGVVVDDPALRRALNTAMDEKYGFADLLFRAMVDTEAVAPVRLDPLPAGSNPPHSPPAPAPH